MSSGLEVQLKKTNKKIQGLKREFIEFRIEIIQRLSYTTIGISGLTYELFLHPNDSGLQIDKSIPPA